MKIDSFKEFHVYTNDDGTQRRECLTETKVKETQHGHRFISEGSMTINKCKITINIDDIIVDNADSVSNVTIDIN